MQYFGKYLVQQGAITQAQLEEATQSLVIFGGRLGTNLVELGHLRLEDLEKHLAAHLGVAVAPQEWIDHPEPRALEAVPLAVAERYRVFPLRLEKLTLHVAMQSPQDARLVDEIAFALDRRIQPYLLSESRLSFLLERYYGVTRERRYIHLGPPGSRAEAKRPTDDAADAPPPPPARDEKPPEREALGLPPLESEQELVDEETFSSLHASWQPPRGSEASDPEDAPELVLSEQAVPSPPVEAALLEERLATARDREVVNWVTLRLARIHASGAALFFVNRGVISGWRAVGEGFEKNIEGILFPCNSSCLPASVARNGERVRATPPWTGMDARLLDALGRGQATEVAVVPIKIRGRVVNLLYVDNEAHPLAETSLAALEVLGECVSRSYERLILERKRHHC